MYACRLAGQDGSLYGVHESLMSNKLGLKCVVRSRVLPSNFDGGVFRVGTMQSKEMEDHAYLEKKGMRYMGEKGEPEAVSSKGF